MREQPTPHTGPCSAPRCGVPSSRFYLCGWRCPLHSPAALARKAEHVPPPVQSAAR